MAEGRKNKLYNIDTINDVPSTPDYSLPFLRTTFQPDLTMEDQYQTIGAKYNAVKLKPSVQFTEVATVLEMLDALHGKTVIDLACGTGFYTRLIRKNGAERVVGVDASQAMIDVARAQELIDAQLIEYRTADVATMGSIGTFDIATAIWLLHYAKTEHELVAMCQNIGRNLVPSGRLVAIIPNPYFINAQDDTEIYRFRTRVISREDTVPNVRMDFIGDEIFSIDYKQWPLSAYVRALRLAGFSSIENRPVLVSQNGIDEMGLDYWNSFRKNPISMGLVADYRA